ncbi:MAG: efflux RND transporter permease subunit [Deltaproteobacteria bacterium]|nr:efflux RND transporter permease subunit [Deltaproteobacteria bacterium]
MIEKLIAYCAKRKFLVLIFSLVGILWGIFAMRNIPIDAIPDLSDPQVIIKTDWKGRSPDLIEDQITYPIVSAMVSAPKAKVARGFSMFGSSFVYVIFEEGTDIYWARSRVLEYLSKIQSQLPEGTQPFLGPDATGVGWVLSYALVDRSGNNSIEDLRAFQDWKLRYLIEAIPGVAELATVGGFQKQYQIQINPNTLAQYGLTLKQVANKVKASNRDVGGRILEMSEREYFVRGLGYIQSIEDIKKINLKTTAQGAPVLLENVAIVTMGPEIRRGASDFNGEGEAVSGIVVMRSGENANFVIQKVKEELSKIKKSLPKGTELVITYDRSKLINRSIDTLTKKLIEEILVVALVILIFLWHLRSSLVAMISLPIAVILSFIPMYYLGISANIMSLGGIAIAIGAMVDAAIIMIENAHKSLETWQEEGKKENLNQVLIRACQQVGRPVFYSLLVIAVSFTPIFVLQGQEGYLFKPLAFTKNASMFFAALLAITLVPPLILLLIGAPQKDSKQKQNRFVIFWKGGKIYSEEQHPISQILFKIYTPVLKFFLRFRVAAIIISGILVVGIIPIYSQLGEEFLPPLNEGDILYMPTTLPGISIETARTWMQQQNKLIKSLPEVKTIFGKVGRADTATDPAPLSMVETVIQLHPQEEWSKTFHSRWYSSWSPEILKKMLRLIWPEMQTKTWEELIAQLETRVKLPGTPNAWVFPIRTRIDMLTTGIRTPVGVKIFGDDLKELESLAIQVEGLAGQMPGTRSAIAERSLGAYYLDIKIRRDNLSLYGMTIEDAQSVVEGVIGSHQLTTTIEGRERFSVNMRYQTAFRQDLEQLKRSLVTVSDKTQIPLEKIAEFKINRGPPMIKDENGMLSSWVFIDLEPGQDMVSYVKKLENLIDEKISFPIGYTYSLSGQHEYLKRAKERLFYVIPITLFVIAFLIYLNTRSWIRTFIVFLAVPFSLIGAFCLLYFLDYKMSIAVWVGLIALAGVDAETGVVMLLYLDLAYEDHKLKNKMNNMQDLQNAVVEGAVKRIRPKVMTVLTTFLGLMPIMWAASYESGADMTKRIAAPMVGGIFTSFLLELLIYPCFFMLWKWHSEVKKSR